MHLFRSQATPVTEEELSSVAQAGLVTSLRGAPFIAPQQPQEAPVTIDKSQIPRVPSSNITAMQKLLQSDPNLHKSVEEETTLLPWQIELQQQQQHQKIWEREEQERLRVEMAGSQLVPKEEPKPLTPNLTRKKLQRKKVEEQRKQIIVDSSSTDIDSDFDKMVEENWIMSQKAEGKPVPKHIIRKGLPKQKSEGSEVSRPIETFRWKQPEPEPMPADPRDMTPRQVEDKIWELRKMTEAQTEDMGTFTREMDVPEDDKSKMSLTEKMAMFQQFEKDAKSAGVQLPMTPKTARRFLDRRKRMERSKTQPITEEEVTQAAVIAKSQRQEQQGYQVQQSYQIQQSQPVQHVQPMKQVHPVQQEVTVTAQPDAVNRLRSDESEELKSSEQEEDELSKYLFLLSISLNILAMCPKRTQAQVLLYYITTQ